MMVYLLLILLSFVYNTSCYEKRVYKVGGLFNDDDEIIAFETAIDIMNRRYKLFQLKLIPLAVKIPTQNSLHAYNSACQLLEKGIIGLFGPSSIHSSSYIQALCDVKEIPHVETHRDINPERNSDLANVHPHPRTLSHVIYNLVEVFDWKSLIILYDNYENLLSVSLLMDFNVQGRTVVLRQLEPDENGFDEYRTVLAKVKLTKETKFILICSTDILEAVLKQLQEVGMMTDAYSYIIADLDMHTVDLQPFKYAGTNITGIRIVDPDQQEVINTASEIEKRKSNGNSTVLPVVAAWKLKLQLALIVDAVHLFYETLIGTERMIVKTKPIDCDSDDNWVRGLSIINSLKMQTVRGLTGLVHFGEELFRNDFIVDILELAPGGLIKVGNWNSTRNVIEFNRIQKPRVFGEGHEASKFNKTFIVLITINAPYAMLKETTTQLFGNDRYEGFCIDMIQKLSEMLGFNYTFVEQYDGLNGSFDNKTQKWDGMIGKILAGEADLAITDLTINLEREKAVDFTMPFMNLGITILYKKPEPVPPSLFMFASPFSVLVWTMLGVSYFVVSISIFVMGRLSPAEWQNPYPCVEEPEYLVNQFTIRNSLWFTIGALMQQGTELAPVALSTRTASGVWWFFVLIMVSSYTANLAAFLTVETFVTPFKDINELAVQTDIKYGAKKGGATANYFRDSNETAYKQIYAYMSEHKENMVSGNDEGARKVETENYAFLVESTALEYITERHCSLAQVGDNLDDKGYGIAMVKDAPYRNEISRAVLKLQEMGTIASMKIEWWSEKRGGGKCSKKPEAGEAAALNLQNIGGVFLVLFVGAILGVIGSFLELIFRIHKKSKIHKLSFKEEMKKELKFFKQFKQHVREVSDPNLQDLNDKKLIEEIEY